MLLPFVAAALFAGTVSVEPEKKNAELQGRELLLAIHNDVRRIKNQTQEVTSLLRSGCVDCFDGLACFDKCNGIFSHISGSPQDPSEVKTRFIIYSRRDREKGLSLDYHDFKPDKSFLDAPRKIVFLVHGFSSRANAEWVVNIRRAILEIEDALVIAVDWSQGAVIPYYAQAVVNTELVGRQIAVVLHKLWRFSPKNVSPARTHYIGHSLGAQMAMFFSRYFRELSGDVPIGHITALDPAAPLFEAYNVCLNRSDATFIDAIHTAAGGFDDILKGRLGVTRKVGHVDFYVNGGSEQPGCGMMEYICSHKRAHIYYLEALRANASCKFHSYACQGGMEEYTAGHCRKVPGHFNGISFDKSHEMPGRGMQFVDTGSSSPYCK